MLTVKKSDIGKRVICGIYIPQGKAYGEIVSFTEAHITVKTDPYGKLVVYEFDDVDLDFQPGEEFVTDMREQLDKFNGYTHAKEEVVVKEPEVVVGAEPKLVSACQMIQVKDGI